MNLKQIAFFAALMALPLTSSIQAQETVLREAYADMRGSLADSKARFRYTRGSSVCFNGRGQQGYNEIDYGKRDGECANLRHKKLAGADFSGFNLKGADLTSASLPGADLRGADLTGATLFVTNFTRADLTGAVLYHLDMNSSTLVDAVFVRARVVLTNMKGADMRGADFRGADLSASDLRYTAVAGCDFRGAFYDANTLLPFSVESARLRGLLLRKAQL